MTDLNRESVDDVFADPDLVRHLREELAAARETEDFNMQLASRVHRSLLPSPIRHPRIDVDVRYSPVETLSGDYCQVRFPDPSSCYVTMCQVRGPGVAPALLATRVSSEVRHLILDCLRPAEIVRSLNEFIYDHFHGANMSLSFLAAQIDLDHKTIIYSGAGNATVLHLRTPAGVVGRLESQNKVIGLQKECLGKEPERTRSLDAGDRLLFFTGALPQSIDATDERSGKHQLEQLATDAVSSGLFDMADKILDQVSQHHDGPPKKGTTLIDAEIK
ncbi:MAG: hypothetical protein CMJ64_07110 [Planctomycetaceae bacterium]|nr:hypothetical protein [Planctomycetaceae bacterium]